MHVEYEQEEDIAHFEESLASFAVIQVGNDALNAKNTQNFQNSKKPH